MLVASGIGSIAVLKKLAGARWLIADQLPLPEGGRRRVWSFTEVVHASLVFEVSRRSSMPLIATGMLLQSATSSWVDEAVRLTAKIDWVMGRTGSRDLRAVSRLMIIDGREGWREIKPGRFELFAQDMVLGGAAITIPRVRKHIEAEVEKVSGRGVSIHAINIHQLDLPVIGHAREALRMR